MFLFWPVKLALRLVELAVTAAIVYLVVTGVQVVQASHLPTSATATPHARAIVVLGVGSVSPTDLAARLEQAGALYHAGVADKVLLAGPPGSSPRAAAGALLPGVPARPVFGAGDAGQLRAAEAVLGKGSVVVVTDAVNAMWTERAAREVGFTATVSPAVGTERFVFQEIGALWRETSAVAVGRVIGYGRASWG